MGTHYDRSVRYFERKGRIIVLSLAHTAGVHYISAVSTMYLLPSS